MKKMGNIGAVRRLIKLIWEKDRALFLHIALYTVTATIYPFCAVMLPKIAIGALENPGESPVLSLVIKLAVYFAAAALLGFISNKEDSFIQSGNMALRMEYFDQMEEKLMTMDYKHCEDSNFWNKNESSIEAVSGDDIGINGVYNQLYILLPKLLAVILMILMTGALDPLIVACLLVHTAVVFFVGKWNNSYSYERKEESARLNRHIEYYKNVSTDFTAGKDMRIFNLCDRILENYRKTIREYIRFFTGIQNHSFATKLLSILTLSVTNVIMYFVLVRQALNGLSISSFSMYVGLITSLMAMMIEIANILSYINEELLSVRDFFGFMDDESYETKGGIDLTTEDTLEIVFDHVSFKYPGSEKNVITDLNLKIEKGERLAIVGVNGAGKSTIIKLITGMFEPTEGTIYINGQDITKVNKKSLYRLFGAVFQDVNVFAFNVKENVACNDSDIDEKRVEKALQSVNLLNKVKGFEKGLNQTMLKVIDPDGTDFSGGERQKLSIARGLYKNAPMVIMDEPTAALDALAEADIYKSFSDLVQGKTAIYISHRLASTKFCDKIALFSKDGLIEYGNHDELMARHGEYYNMFTVQGKYYQEEAV